MIQKGSICHINKNMARALVYTDSQILLSNEVAMTNQGSIDSLGDPEWSMAQTVCMIMMTSSNGNITGHRRIPRTKATDAELWCILWSAPWINGWVNNREAGDLRRHCAHYDVTVMCQTLCDLVITKSIPVQFWYIGKDAPGRSSCKQTAAQ